MLVDHLRDRVLEQDDILIERFDLPLQFDAVDEINRNLDMLLGARVQERVFVAFALYCSFLLLRFVEEASRGLRTRLLARTFMFRSAAPRLPGPDAGGLQRMGGIDPTRCG